MNTYCVYKHTSPSGKVYIGITKKKPSYRWVNGLGYKSSPHFWSAIQKYGWESFKHEVLFTDLSCDEACAMEQELIAQYKATDRLYGYNEKAGGQKGSALNETARAKISASLKNFYAEHPEMLMAMAQRATGFHHTAEAKAKISASKKGKTFTETDEWKANIGAANKRKLMEDKNLYAATVARCKANGAKSAIPVVQMDLAGRDIASFKSATEAQRKTGAKNGNIILCCRGLRHTANGYKWRFANTDNGGREIA